MSSRNWLLGLLLALPICAVADEVELSVPVRVLGSAPAPQPEDMPQRPAPAEPPTVTRGLLPQYQSESVFGADAARPPSSQSSLRFLLALPHQLLLLEATVTIDGQPFETVRERRIERLIAELPPPAAGETPPAAEPDAAEPAANESPAAADDAAAEDADARDAADESPDESPVESPKPDASPDEPPDESPKESPDESPDASPRESADESPQQVDLLPVPSTELAARLRRYAAVTGRPPSRDELRWLLTKWIDGPTLLLLDENFQRFRGLQAPAFQVLDRDMDGTISQQELAAARETLLSCDVNQNDVVEYTEIAEVADDPRRQARPNSIQALIPILEKAAVAKAFRRLAGRYASPDAVRRFDANLDGELDDAETAQLGEMAPDVSIVVSFDVRDAAKSTTSVTRISPSLNGAPASTKLVGPWITIPVGGTLLEFSAVQPAASSGSDQVSVGIVNDGYPLLPAIDPNEDGRLTIRELRNVLAYLKPFDVNQDGAISAEEIPSTVRVAFGLGPSVHRHLADLRTVHAPVTTPRVAVPAWFTRMDANQDGDVSPREFLLGRDKFQQWDADGDGLISPQEAVDLAGGEATGAQHKPAPQP